MFRKIFKELKRPLQQAYSVQPKKNYTSLSHAMHQFPRILSSQTISELLAESSLSQQYTGFIESQKTTRMDANLACKVNARLLAEYSHQLKSEVVDDALKLDDATRKFSKI